MRRQAAQGWTLIELLVGSTLGLVVLAGLTATVAAGSRLLVVSGARGEAEDTVHLALEALTFDARRAGYDPRGVGIAGLTEAAPDRLALAADLDGDGTIDAASEETAAYACLPATQRLARIIGRQSMPLADGVRRCTFHYLDASGTTMPAPAGGLGAADRLRVRALGLELTLAPTALHGEVTRTAVVAMRSLP